MSCKIKAVVMGSSVINPLLINIDDKIMTNEDLSKGECSWFESESESSTHVINFVHYKDCYQGTTSKMKQHKSKRMLVLQNKKTNKVQLIEVDECRLGRVSQKPSLQAVYENSDMQTTYEDNKTKLLKAFGSKKSNRASEIGSKTKINSEIMTSQIKHTAAVVNIDTKELEMADSSIDTCLPPCHRNASNPSEVYILEDFLTQHELDSMTDEAFVIMNLMPFTELESGYSQFFIDLIEHLQNKINLEKVKILLFVEALIRFINLPLKKLKKKDIVEKISPFSSLVTKKIIEHYTVDSGEGRTRNVTMDDKIVIHVIVLIIIACDFCCNIEELSKYLPKFSIKKLGQIARALCLTTKDKVTWFIKLPLPATRSVFMRRRT